MKLSTYLTGPITLRHNEPCREWRLMVTEKLKPWGIEALNPFNIEGNTDEIRKQIYSANERGELGITRSLVSSHMIKEDLKMVEKATFLTVWIPKLNGYEICGSYGEVTLAYYLGKPVYVITERNLKPNELPSWLIGCSKEIFSSWDEYFSFIEKKYVVSKRLYHELINTFHFSRKVADGDKYPNKNLEEIIQIVLNSEPDA